ncbi:MAG TPA: hypothetical protein VFV80_09845, partial [Geminicoccaceae bacterium]|nr:hypothetical protein [Geminicoccaceae bacterium]
MPRAYRPQRPSLVAAAIVVAGLIWPGAGPLAQVEAPRAAPPLVQEVGRLVSRYFYDPDVARRVWAEARAAHGDLPTDPTDDEVAAALQAMLGELGASHTGHYTQGEVAYYELLDIFARDDWAPR